jgi:hypothetical protein
MTTLLVIASSLVPRQKRVRSGPRMGTKRIRRAAREGRCEFTLHALEEMDEDDLAETEVLDVLLRGRLGARQSRDARGVRFVVRGRSSASDARVEIVCRFLPGGTLRIITAYRLED